MTRQFIRIRVRSRGTSPGFFFFLFSPLGFSNGAAGELDLAANNKGKGEQREEQKNKNSLLKFCVTDFSKE